jgi:hypothetical protein
MTAKSRKLGSMNGKCPLGRPGMRYENNIKLPAVFTAVWCVM